MVPEVDQGKSFPDRWLFNFIINSLLILSIFAALLLKVHDADNWFIATGFLYLANIIDSCCSETYKFIKNVQSSKNIREKIQK